MSIPQNGQTHSNNSLLKELILAVESKPDISSKPTTKTLEKGVKYVPIEQ